MPGTPPTTPKLAIPRFASTDAADFPTQYNAGVDQIDLRSPSLETALPGSPFDKQEIYYVADAASGVIWHLRYRAASPSAYKWEFLGGPPLVNEVATLGNTASSTYTDLASVGPTVALFLAGEYDIAIQAYIIAGSGTDAMMAFRIGGAATSDGDRIMASLNLRATLSASMRRVVAPAGVIKAEYRNGATGQPAAQFMQRWLKVTPVRVG